MTLGGFTFSVKRQDVLTESTSAAKFDAFGSDKDHVTSPMPGKVIKINFGEGDTVKKGDVLLIVEAMKMENKIVSPRDGIVEKISVAVNERVEVSNALILLEKTQA
jgi:3-methylcrotonyl-CoA carboxylase alpha subunit